MWIIQLKRLIRPNWIHRRQHATQQQQLQSVRAQLASIVETSEDGIIGEDLNGIITSWNQSAEQMYGYSPHETIGHSISMLVPPGREGETAALLDRIKRGEQLRHYETQRLGKSGMLLDVSLNVSPITNALGQIVGASTIDRNLTPHKGAKLSLQESEARFRNLVETAPLAIVMMNALGNITLVNDRATTLFGYEREDLLGQPVERLLPERFHAAHRLYWEGYFAAPSARPMGQGRDLSGRRKDGTEFPAEVGLSHFRTKGVPVAVAFITDISETVNLYQAEQKARQAAEAANEAKVLFLATISHELRTPLAAMKGFTTTLLATDVTFDEARQREFIGIIDEESDRMTELIEQLLDTSLLQSGTLKIERARHSVNEIVETASKQLKPLLAGRHWLINLAPDLPDVLADKQRIVQVIGNLVGNGIKYSTPDTTITLTVRRDRDVVQFDVSDEGIGIPPASRAEVFEAFRRLDGAQKGIGLGLAICKGLVEAHNGRIWVQDRPLPGTTLSFTIPVLSHAK